MSSEVNGTNEKPRTAKKVYRGGGSDAVYGLGLLGAWYYYLSTATSFGVGVLGILKGIIWPGMLVYELLKYLGM
jgi:hypothetical protein